MTTKVKDKKKLQFLRKFEESGNISSCCECIDISRNTFYMWKDADTDFADAFEAIQESVGDFVEDQLLMQIKEGEIAATIFYCKTKLRKRGYVEKIENVTELKVTERKIIEEYDLNKLTIEELEDLEKLQTQIIDLKAKCKNNDSR